MARNKSVKNSKHWHVGLRNKHNLNEEMILHGICLQLILVCSLVTNLDFHDKMYSWDLTYLHTDKPMLQVYHEEALVTVEN